MIFLAMGAGIICGMGYLAYALLFSVVMGCAMALFSMFGSSFLRLSQSDKTLHITIPEDLNYSSAFDDLFRQYTTHCEPVSVKTTNMGSLYKLTYHLTLKDPNNEKELIDLLRCRNGNLEISMTRQEAGSYEL